MRTIHTSWLLSVFWVFCVYLAMWPTCVLYTLYTLYDAAMKECNLLKIYIVYVRMNKQTKNNTFILHT